MRTLRLLTLSILLLSLFGCKSSLTTTLNLVVAASEAAVGVLESTGSLPPAVGSQITTYLQLVSEATSFATTELASADTSQVKALKIAQEFAKIAQPTFGPGTPQTVINVVQSVVTAVLNFLQTIQPPPGAHAARTAPPNIKLSADDMKTLDGINVRALQVKARLIRLH